MDPNELKPRRGASSTSKPATSKNSKYAFMNLATKSDEPRIFDCTKLDTETLQNAIGTVTAAGDLISFTLTQDGGALCISVVSNGERYKQYAATMQAANDILEALTV
jgi:hypothetical protein